MKIKITRPKTELEKKKERKRSHQEAAVNTIVGILINQGILLAFGMPLTQATIITAIMVLVSYLRSYVIRRIFSRQA